MARPASSLSENLITLLGLSPEGRAVANIVTVDLFEGDLRLVAERCLQFWREHDEPPGAHLADLFSDIFDKGDDPRAHALRRILSDMTALMAGINTQYVLSQISTFVRIQALKQAVLRAADLLQRGTAQTVGDVETI